MWDPKKYLAFDDHRSRPFFDLLGRIAAESPRRVVDLGCGPGHLTASLAERWPGAIIEASDSSPEMVAAARSLGIDATLGTVEDWRPAPDADVVITVAAVPPNLRRSAEDGLRGQRLNAWLYFPAISRWCSQAAIPTSERFCDGSAL